MYTTQTVSDLEIALGGPVPIEFLPKLRAYREELETHKISEARRQEEREKTIIRKDLIDKAYQTGINYALQTFDPSKEHGDETRSGGFLYLIGDWQEPGMSSDYQAPDGGILYSQIETLQEFYLGKKPFENGISLSDDKRPGLEDLMNHYLNQPHSEDNDLAIFIDHDDGEVMSTHAHIEGVRGKRIELDPHMYKGGAKARAALYWTKINPDNVAIMGSGAGFVYLIQHGEVKMKFDVEKQTHVKYKEIASSEITSSDERCGYLKHQM